MLASGWDRSLRQPHCWRTGPQRWIRGDGQVLASEDGRRPGDEASGDGGANSTRSVESDVRGGHVEDADEAREVVAVEVVGACVGRARLFWPRLEQDDAVVLVAAEDVDVAATLHGDTTRRREVNEHRGRVDGRKGTG